MQFEINNDQLEYGIAFLNELSLFYLISSFNPYYALSVSLDNPIFENQSPHKMDGLFRQTQVVIFNEDFKDKHNISIKDLNSKNLYGLNKIDNIYIIRSAFGVYRISLPIDTLLRIDNQHYESDFTKDNIIMRYFDWNLREKMLEADSLHFSSLDRLLSRFRQEDF